MDTTIDKPTTQAVKEIAESSKQAFEAGQRIAQDVDILERKLEHATDWRAQFSEKPLIFIGAAMLAGILLWRIAR